MSKDKKFDKYIKGLFDEDPKAPTELRWEAMDFDLPNFKEKEPKSNKKYWILLLLLLFSSSVLYLANKYDLISIGQEKQALNESSANTQTIETAVAKKESEIKDQSAKQQATSQEANISNKVLRELSETSSETVLKDQSNLKDLNSGQLKSTSKTNKTPIIENIESGIKDINRGTKDLLLSKALTTKSSSNTSSKNISLVPDLETFTGIDQSASSAVSTSPKPDYTTSSLANTNSEISDSESLTIKTDSGVDHSGSGTNVNSTMEQSISSNVEILPTIGLNKLPNDIKQEITLMGRPTLSYNSERELPNQFVMEDLLIGYAGNTYELKIADSNILKDKVSKAFGSSFKAGLRFGINRNWKSVLVVKYDRYHSIFEHTRELDVLYNLEALRKTSRMEVTYKNNYTNILGLEIGIEKRWRLIKQLELSTGIGITPNYAISTSGKTTQNTMVEDLVYNSELSKFSINGGVTLGLMYPLSRSINLEAAYQFNNFFVNSIFINNDVHTSQQTNISLGISYQLRK